MRELLLIGNCELYPVQQVLRGVIADADFARRWMVRVQSETTGAGVWSGLFPSATPDGLIVLFCASPQIIREISMCGVPCVAIGYHETALRANLVVDNDAVGRMAAEYFLERHFSHFAFLGTRGLTDLSQRLEGYRKQLRKKGADCFDLFIRAHHNPLVLLDKQGTIRQFSAWLRTLPKPCALFACDDRVGMLALETCLYEDLRVPEDIAVLGVNDNELLCRVTYPRMSSIRLPFSEMGREAAQLLDDWLEGRPPQRNTWLFPPVDVAERASADFREVADPLVAQAVHFIEEHLAQPFRIRDVEAACGVTTPTLVARFRKALGRTPIEEARRQRIVRAKRLLIDSEASVEHIARQCGFRSPTRFGIVFREMTGVTPLHYRRWELPRTP